MCVYTSIYTYRGYEKSKCDYTLLFIRGSRRHGGIMLSKPPAEFSRERARVLSRIFINKDAANSVCVWALDLMRQMYKTRYGVYVYCLWNRKITIVECFVCSLILVEINFGWWIDLLADVYATKTLCLDFKVRHLEEKKYIVFIVWKIKSSSFYDCPMYIYTQTFYSTASWISFYWGCHLRAVRQNSRLHFQQ